MEKSHSFHSVIVPAEHVVTIECFINGGCTTRKSVIVLCVIYTQREHYQCNEGCMHSISGIK